MTSATAASGPGIAPDMRRVLNAPRGRRFSRPTLPSRPPRPSTDYEPPLASLGRNPRERALLAHMPDTPRLRHRLTHGDLPLWMTVSEPSEPRPRPTPRPARDPQPGDGPAPGPEPVRIPRPRRERPPLPRRSDRPRRPASHRRPRRRLGRPWVGYALATTLGTLVQPLLGWLG